MPFFVLAITEYCLPGPDLILAGLALMMTLREDTAGAFATTNAVDGAVKSFASLSGITHEESEAAVATATAAQTIFLRMLLLFMIIIDSLALTEN